MDQRILDGKTVVIADVSQDKGVQYPEAAAAEGLQGMVSVPLRVRSQIIGVLRIYGEGPSSPEPVPDR
jgi:hypothetical protein